MKQIILLIIVGLVGSVVRRRMKFNVYPLLICNCGATTRIAWSMTRRSWDKRSWQSNAYDEVKDDLEERKPSSEKLRAVA